MEPFINIHTHRKPQDGECVIRNAWLPRDIIQILPEGYSTSIGVHPWCADKISIQEIENRLEKLIHLSHVKAIGEIGLDRVNGPAFSIQKNVFEYQLQIAKKYNKPVIIHCVKSYADLLLYIKQYNVTFILHDYHGNEQTTQQLLAFENVYFSFGKLLYRDEKIARERLQQIPLNRLFFETDTMKINIQEVYKKASDLLGIEKEVLRKTTFDNFHRVIGI